MATNIYYAVGQNTTDHKTGSPTCTISSAIMTFTVAQTATNLGVGDRVTYDTSKIAYLATKTSTTVWNVVTAVGANPSDEGSAVTVNSIAHEYTSIKLAEAGSGDASHMNSTDLVSSDFILFIACYRDTGPDVDETFILGYTTDATNYIQIYTPDNEDTECNQSQRHNNVWDTNKFSVVEPSASCFKIVTLGFKLIGIQCTITTAGDADHIIKTNAQASASDITISHCICAGDGNPTDGDRTNGIFFVDQHASSVLRAFNNIIYNMGTGDLTRGIRSLDSGPSHLYHNVCFGCWHGIQTAVSASNTTVKNNICFGNTGGNDYAGDYNAASTNNAYVNRAPPGASNDIALTTATAADYVNSATDFRVNASGGQHSAEIIDAGADLVADAIIPISDDAGGFKRDGIPTVGATEYIKKINVN